jgi:hypothetical protein
MFLSDRVAASVKASRGETISMSTMKHLLSLKPKKDSIPGVINLPEPLKDKQGMAKR